jgi:hypothetical protein
MAQPRPGTSDAVLLCSRLPDATALSRLTDCLRPHGLVPERGCSDGYSRLYSGADRHLQLQLVALPMAAEGFPPGCFATGAGGTLLTSHQAHIRILSGDGPAPGAPCEDDDASPAPFELLQISYRAARALALDDGTRALCWMPSGVMQTLDELPCHSDRPSHDIRPPWSLLARPQVLSCGRVRMQGARQIVGSDIDLLTGGHPRDVIAETGLIALQIFATSHTPARDALAPAIWGRNAQGTFIVRLPALATPPAPEALPAAPGLATADDVVPLEMPRGPAQNPLPPGPAATATHAGPWPPRVRKQPLPQTPDPDQRQGRAAGRPPTGTQALAHLRPPSGGPETDPPRPHHARHTCQRHPEAPRPGAVSDTDTGVSPSPHPGPRPGAQPGTATLIAALGRPADSPAANPLPRRITTAAEPGAGTRCSTGFGAGFVSGARSGLGSGVIIALALGLALFLLSPSGEQLTETRPAAARPAQR